MYTGEKIAKLRKENNYTQEQLAELLGVSRQSVSKYESGVAYPETEKLIRLSDLFHCSLDYLLKDEIEELAQTDACQGEYTDGVLQIRYSGIRIKEKTSKHMIFGMPLWQIGKNAKGFIAIGIRAKGVISIGMFSMGILSIGLFSLGLFSIGAFSLGVLAAVGSLAAGIFACGACSIGIISIGAVAIGEFSIGALAIGHYFAYGDTAIGMYAFGGTSADGSVFASLQDLSAVEKESVIQGMLQKVPSFYHWIVRWFTTLL